MHWDCRTEPGPRLGLKNGNLLTGPCCCDIGILRFGACALVLGHAIAFEGLTNEVCLPVWHVCNPMHM